MGITCNMHAGLFKITKFDSSECKFFPVLRVVYRKCTLHELGIVENEDPHQISITMAEE